MFQDASHQDINGSIPLPVDNLFHTSPDTLQEKIFNIFTSILRKPFSCLASLTIMMTMLSESRMAQIIGLGADTPPRLQHWHAVSRPPSYHKTSLTVRERLSQSRDGFQITARQVEAASFIDGCVHLQIQSHTHFRTCVTEVSGTGMVSASSAHRQSCTTSGRTEHPRERRIWPLWRGSRLGPNSAGGNWSELRQRNRWSRLRDSAHSWWMTFPNRTYFRDHSRSRRWSQLPFFSFSSCCRRLPTVGCVVHKHILLMRSCRARVVSFHSKYQIGVVRFTVWHRRTSLLSLTSRHGVVRTSCFPRSIHGLADPLSFMLAEIPQKTPRSPQWRLPCDVQTMELFAKEDAHRGRPTSDFLCRAMRHLAHDRQLRYRQSTAPAPENGRGWFWIHPTARSVLVDQCEQSGSQQPSLAGESPASLVQGIISGETYGSPRSMYARLDQW